MQKFSVPCPIMTMKLQSQIKNTLITYFQKMTSLAAKA